MFKQKSEQAKAHPDMASPTGIEPVAFRLGGGPSILLRYGDIFNYATIVLYTIQAQNVKHINKKIPQKLAILRDYLW